MNEAEICTNVSRATWQLITSQLFIEYLALEKGHPLAQPPAFRLIFGE